MIKLGQTPREYLFDGNYKHLVLEGVPPNIQLSDMELAIISFVSHSRPADTQGIEVVSHPKDVKLPKYVHARSNSELMELVFEYLKLNGQEAHIREIIKRNIGSLEKELKCIADYEAAGTKLPDLRRKAEELKSGFEQLSGISYDSISYNDTNPSHPATVRFIGPHITPFAYYSRNIMNKLVRKGVALKYVDYDHGRKGYFAINPDIRITVAKK